jgi:putative oxidoreductase
MIRRLVPYVLLLVRVVVGFLFIAASIDKIASPDTFAAAIGNYHLLPSSLLVPVATVLPWMELLCGIGLVSGFHDRGSALLVSCMLIVFTLAVFTALFRGLDISCGCFTLDPGVRHVGWSKIIENLLLLGASLTALFVKDQGLHPLLQSHRPEEKQ